VILRIIAVNDKKKPLVSSGLISDVRTALVFIDLTIIVS
jgi:hypothetical protein